MVRDVIEKKPAAEVHPANLNVRITLVMYEAIRDYAQRNELAVSEAARQLLGHGLDSDADARSGGFHRFVDEDDE
jgi:hypothetical protein